MTLFFEISAVIIATFAALIYASDTIYWIYDNEKDKLEEEEKDEEAEKIKEQVAKTLYS